MKKVLMLILAISAIVTIGVTRGPGGGWQGGNGGQVGSITEEQKVTLFYIYQEEKLARDTYITLGKVYPAEKTFQNIQLSEQNHIDAMRGLCLKYNIDISNVNENEIGIFVLDSVQNLYNQFISYGNIGLIEALYVGQHIEIMDIEDLEKAKDGMPRDVQRVLSRLLNGSKNHLNAFNNAISRELGK